MMKLDSKHGEVIIYAQTIEQEAVSQIKEMADSPLGENAHIRIMPDAHAGAGCVIGTTMRITDKVCPNTVGVDIGCGMETVHLAEKDIDLQKLDETIRNYIPSGFDIRTTPHDYAASVNLGELRCRNGVDMERAYNSIGTLGGGNHFIEVDKDEQGQLYLIVHSGSRHLGIEVANYYQEKAYELLSRPDKSEIKRIVERLKSEKRQNEIQQALAEYQKSISCVPKALAYCEGALFDDYIHDMRIIQSFADFNRKAMIAEIITQVDLHTMNAFTTIHNYIDTENMILRKGAVSAQAGQKLLIPINMRDGSLICIGKGNPDWNYSAPHGAGRLYSRSKARELFSVEEYAATMTSVFTTCVNENTIDEAPFVYKNAEEIVSCIEPTVEILHRITPVYNFKAN